MAGRELAPAGRTLAAVAAKGILARAPADPSLADTSLADREKRIHTLERLVVRIGTTLILIIVALMVLAAFDVQIGPALAGLGVAGIAVGFGAQTLVRDWLAGIFILAENQYSRGDVVSIAGVAGVVEDFSLRRTVLRDLDGVVHTVPNGQVAVASNLTRLWARVNLDVQVAYGTDMSEATRVLDKIGRQLAEDAEWASRIVEAPSVLRVEELGDSGVTLKILGTVRPGDQWAVTGELRRRILAAFGKARIEIPYPHRTVITRDESATASD
jgi:moderate conductance mechanosensitive channel